MGNFFSPLSSTLQQNHVTNAKILMCGLDDSGKTTLLSKITKSEVDVSMPVIGFNVESATTHGLDFVSWDVGGRNKIRPLYRHYYDNVNAIIFVVDSNDRERIEYAQYELHMITKEDQLSDAIVVIYANKQDLPDAMSVGEIHDKLNLDSLCQRWFIQATCGTSADGIFEGLEWIASNMKKSSD